MFVRKHYGRRKGAIFSIARDTVCKIKSQSKSGRENLDKIQKILKPSKPKAGADAFDGLPMVQSEEVDDFEDDFGDEWFDLGDVDE